MDQWNTLQHLPTFWSTVRPWHIAVVVGFVLVTVIATVVTFKLVKRSVIAHMEARSEAIQALAHAPAKGRAAAEKRAAVARDDIRWDAGRTAEMASMRVAAVLGAIAVFTCATFGLDHLNAHEKAVKDLVVDYVSSTTHLTALSPVTLYEDNAAAFEAVQPDGTIVDVTVKWMALDGYHTYRSSDELPATMKPFTVTTKTAGTSN